MKYTQLLRVKKEVMKINKEVWSDTKQETRTFNMNQRLERFVSKCEWLSGNC